MVNAAANSQQAGVARKNSTARMKVTALCPTVADIIIAATTGRHQSRRTLTRFAVGSRGKQFGQGRDVKVVEARAVTGGFAMLAPVEALLLRKGHGHAVLKEAGGGLMIGRVEP